MTIQYLGIMKISKFGKVEYGTAGGDPQDSLSIVLCDMEDLERRDFVSGNRWDAEAVLSYDPETQETKLVHGRKELRGIMNNREDDRMAAE